MRYQLINGESIEIERLDNRVVDVDRALKHGQVIYEFSVTFWDLDGAVVDSYRTTFAETNSMRRHGRRIKDHGPERILMGMRFRSKIASGDPARDLAIYDLFTHLRRRRLGKMKKLH